MPDDSLTAQWDSNHWLSGGNLRISLEFGLFLLSVFFKEVSSVCITGEINRLFLGNWGSPQLLIASIGFCFPFSQDLTTQPLLSARIQPQIPLPGSLSLPPKRCNLFPLWTHRLELQLVWVITALDVICVIEQHTEQPFTGL